MRDEDGGADVVVAAVQAHLEVLVGQLLDQALPPLDDRHRLGRRRVEVEVVDVGDAAQPVGVDVHQGHPPVPVHAGDDEGRRGDRLPDAEARTDPLGERGLPGAQRADQDDEVARPEHLGQGPAQGVRVLRPREHVLASHAAPLPSEAATARRSASSAARGAPFGPNRIAADGW